MASHFAPALDGDVPQGVDEQALEVHQLDRESFAQLLSRALVALGMHHQCQERALLDPAVQSLLELPGIGNFRSDLASRQ